MKICSQIKPTLPKNHKNSYWIKKYYFVKSLCTTCYNFKFLFTIFAWNIIHWKWLWEPILDIWSFEWQAPIKSAITYYLPTSYHSWQEEPSLGFIIREKVYLSLCSLFWNSKFGAPSAPTLTMPLQVTGKWFSNSFGSHSTVQQIMPFPYSQDYQYVRCRKDFISEKSGFHLMFMYCNHFSWKYPSEYFDFMKY